MNATVVLLGSKSPRARSSIVRDPELALAGSQSGA
jgi:hypothetical protein